MNLNIQILFCFISSKLLIQISNEIYVAGVFSDFSLFNSVKLSLHFILSTTHLNVHKLHLLCSEQQKKKCSNCFIKCLRKVSGELPGKIGSYCFTLRPRRTYTLAKC